MFVTFVSLSYSHQQRSGPRCFNHVLPVGVKQKAAIAGVLAKKSTWANLQLLELNAPMYHLLEFTISGSFLAILPSRGVSDTFASHDADYTRAKLSRFQIGVRGSKARCLGEKASVTRPRPQLPIDDQRVKEDRAEC